MFPFILAYQNHIYNRTVCSWDDIHAGFVQLSSAAAQNLHQCHLKSMPFNCIYGFDMLEQRETCFFNDFNHQGKLLWRGVLVALSYFIYCCMPGRWVFRESTPPIAYRSWGRAMRNSEVVLDNILLHTISVGSKEHDSVRTCGGPNNVWQMIKTNQCLRLKDFCLLPYIYECLGWIATI